ncbi:MAG: ABC transporter permease subunit [Synechococcales cyanobacterium CRU_2_2]|nr:ABC transporter permease subunit [Synechococcales cyanobacterium CRU_2_2]
MITTTTAKILELGLDKIGDWNPQLMRELQGRLRWRNLLMALIPTILLQTFIVLKYVVKLPVEGPANRYCMGPTPNGMPLCERLGTSAASGWQTNWPLFWADILKDLSLVVPWVVVLGGVYLLAADLSKEIRRGTLNFLRMSPQQGRQILLGKLLGVPILLYVALVAILPLHSFVALHTDFDFAKILAFYGVLVATMVCFYAAALWFALVAEALQGFQPWLATGLVAVILMAGMQGDAQGSVLNWARLFNPLNSLRFLADNTPSKDNLGIMLDGILTDTHGLRHFAWWYAPIGADFRSYALLAISNALGFGLIYWLLLERRFQSPATSIISKRHSYGLSLWAAVWFVGFDLQQDCADYCFDPNYIPGTPNAIWLFASFSPSFIILGLLLIALLLPTPQALIDWARYRRQGERQSDRPHAQLTRLLQDLLWQDNSPPMLAFGLNGVIVLAVLALGVGVQGTVSLTQLWVIWGLYELLLLNGLLVVQRLAIANFTHWRWMAIGALLAGGLGVPMALGLLGIQTGTSGGSLFLFTLMAPQAVEVANFGAMAIAFAVQLSLTTLLTTTFSRRLGQLGQSEWKALSEQRPRPRLASLDR